MRKRIGSLLLSLALCLSLLPTAALAEEAQPTEPLSGEQLEQVEPVPEENEEQPQQDEAVIAVQALIDALPEASELDGLDEAAQESACLAASEAYEAYDALTEEQQSALTGTENLLAILEWANGQVATLADTATGTEHQSHPVCGASCTDSKHSVESWTAISTATELTNLTGNGYLTQNIDLANTWEPVDGVVLCLNGYSIIGASDKPVISVKSGVFNLTDCKGGSTTGEYGKITHKNTESGRGVNVYATFNMYGGSITGNKTSSYGGGGVYVGSGTFHMYGGSITGNKAESYNGVGGDGGGVCVNVNGSFHMYGGSIAGNSASTDGGGVYVNYGSFEMSGSASITGNTATGNGGGVSLPSGDFTVSGHVQITGNTSKTDSSQSNVFLGTNKYITIGEGGLTNGAEIGVTTATEPTEAAPITIAKNAKDGTEKYFTSDKGYYPVFKENKIVLDTSKPHTHPVCGKTCADGSSHGGVVWQPIADAAALTAITKAGYYYLTDNVTLDDTWTPKNGVHLCLNGYSITSKSNSSSIKVDTGVTFTLTDCKRGDTVDYGKITHDTNCTGRGVTVDTDGSFYMYGGSISHNEITSGTVRQGSGVTVNAGGAFHMYGGSISGNKVSGSNSVGGGVYVGSGTFHMYGGSIAGNTAKSGGGVYMGSGTFHMYGGSISGNTASVNGGGVYVSGGGTFNMSDSARIAGNIATGTDYNGGGGVLLNSGTFNVSGSVSISGNTSSYSKDMPSNVLLSYGQTITIGNSLTDSASIGVSLDNNNYPSSGNRTQIATNATGDVDYNAIFTPDVDGNGYVITKDESGDLYLSAHQHSWTYALKENTTNTIVATCEKGDASGTMTLLVPSILTYTGYNKGLTQNFYPDSTAFKDATITYQVKTGEGENDWGNLPGGATVPADAGTYKATVAVGTGDKAFTASVEYTIAKATPQASDFNVTLPSGDDLTYNGNAKEATVTAKNSGMGDITVKYFKGETQLDSAPTDAGTYTVKIDVAGGDNYNASTADLTADNWKFTIQKADYTGVTKTMEVSVPETQFDSTAYNVNKLTLPQLPEGAQYSGSVTLSDAYKGNEKYSYAVFPSGCIENWEGGTKRELTFKTAGCADGYSATMTFHVTSATNYNDYDVVVTVNFVKQKQETLTGLTMQGWTYGGAVNEPQYTEPEGTTKTTITYAKKNASGDYVDAGTYLTATSDAGEYKVTVVCETPLAVYTGEATFTIEKKTIDQDDLKLAAGESITKVYDGTDKHTENVYLTLKDNDAFTLGVDADKVVYNSANVKDATKATLTLSIPDKMNYKLAEGFTTMEVPASITKATPTVSGNGTASGTYGQKLSEVTVNGLSATLNGKTVAGHWVLTDDTSDTLDTVTLNGSTAEYTAVFTPENTGNFTTAEAKVTVTIAPKEGGSLVGTNRTQKFTDTAEQTYTPDWTGLPAGESWSYNSDCTTTGTAQVSDSSFTADGKTLTYQISGGQAGNTVTFTLKAICASGHYEPFTITLTVTLTDRDPQTFTFNEEAVNKTYGDSDFTFAATGAKTSVTYSSNDESVATVDNTGKVTIKGVGTTTITATAAQSDAYSKAEKSYTLTVGKKSITAPAADQTVYTYNGTGQTYRLAEDGAYTITGNKRTNANEDGYTVTVALKDKANTKWAGEGDDTADKTYQFVIKKATVTVTAKDKSAYVGSTAPALTDPVLDTDHTVSGLFGNDTLTGTLVLKYVDADGKEIQPDMTKAGETIIRPSGVSAGDNYTVEFVDGKLTVTDRPSSGDTTVVYPIVVSDKIENGSVRTDLKSAAKGTTVTVTVDPDKGFTLETLTVLDKDGNELKLTDKGNGKYTFTMPASKVTVKATFMDDNTMLNFFVDVKASDYFYDAVLWAVQSGITNGISGTVFGSNDPCTRAQIVTFLWRAAGSPEPKSASSFADVPASSYYAKAVAWAVENGITTGTGSGKFSPNAACTREQAVTFLYRAAGSPAVSGGSAFSDVAANAYYASAVAWAEKNGITGGIGGGKFGTGSDCTRAQIVTFLHRSYLSK